LTHETGGYPVRSSSLRTFHFTNRKLFVLESYARINSRRQPPTRRKTLFFWVAQNSTHYVKKHPLKFGYHFWQLRKCLENFLFKLKPKLRILYYSIMNNIIGIFIIRNFDEIIHGWACKGVLNVRRLISVYSVLLHLNFSKRQWTISHGKLFKKNA